eukprot:216829_1
MFCCRQCFQIFGDRQRLVSHQKTKNHRKHIEYNHATIRIFKCDYNGCNESFYHSWRLNKHRKLHNKPYMCSVHGCLKSFGDRRNLAIHRRIHNDQRCEKCTFCDKSFKDPSTLRHHIKYLHNNGQIQKPFICRRCHKAFSKRSSLRNHLSSHLKRDDRTLFDCNQCCASFTFKSNLNRHLRKIHSI